MSTKGSNRRNAISTEDRERANLPVLSQESVILELPVAAAGVAKVLRDEIETAYNAAVAAWNIANPDLLWPYGEFCELEGKITGVHINWSESTTAIYIRDNFGILLAGGTTTGYKVPQEGGLFIPKDRWPRASLGYEAVGGVAVVAVYFNK